MTLSIKRLQNCLHPLTIINKYTGKRVTVRCGKCEVCRNSHAATWVQRLDQEQRCHLYTWFVTLQYDEQHVPQMVRIDSDGTPSLDYVDSLSGERISLLDTPSDFVFRSELREKQFCYDTKVLNVLSKRDIQLFIKRLRKYALDYDGNARLRYFITGEYGPQTFRPHYHCLFFLDSPLLSKNFEECLNRSWEHGSVFDPHTVNNGADSYVAQYLNCTTHLPKILLHKSIRPFQLFSRDPIIGAFKNDSIDLRKIFLDSSDALCLYDARSKTFKDVPLWRSLRNRLFPRIPRFTDVDVTIGAILYESILQYFVSGDSEESAFERVKFSYLQHYFPDGYLRRYFDTICYKPDRFGFLLFSESSLRSYVHACFQLYKNCADYGVSVRDGITLLYSYYEKKQKSDLKNYFLWQDDYFSKHPLSEYPLLDAAFVKRVNHRFYFDLKPEERVVLRHCGIDMNPVNLDYESSSDFRQMVSLHTKITCDTTKSKKNNDYLLANKDKFGNIITYKNI